jgi:hypothetical protein
MNFQNDCRCFMTPISNLYKYIRRLEREGERERVREREKEQREREKRET